MIARNNFWNIRDAGFRWQGQVGSIRGFVEFSQPEYGIRAALMIMRNYMFKHGLHSITAIIYRWAPPAENATDDYVRFVANDTKIDPLYFLRERQIPDVMFSMAKMEVGVVLAAKWCNPNEIRRVNLLYNIFSEMGI